MHEEALRERIKRLRRQREVQKAETGRPKSKRLSAKERAKVLNFTDGKCHICGGDIEGRWQADHVRAHSAGGEHSLDNYLAAHSTCNNYRWDYLPEEMELVLKLGVWAKTQVERATPVGREIEKNFSSHEKARMTRRSGTRKE